MVYLYATLLSLVNLVWLFTVIIGLPGTWLIVLTTVGVAWWHGDFSRTPTPGFVDMFHPGTLIALVALAALGEIIEFFAGVAGAKRFGGTRRGALGAIVGGIIGGILGTAIPMPVIGTLIGACAGAAIGTVALEIHGGMKFDAATRAGVGAGIGRFGGTVGKLAVGVVIWLVAAVAAFWP